MSGDDVAALAAVDRATGQGISAAVIATIVVLSSLLDFVQEHRSDRAVQRLRAMVTTTARVLRQPADGVAAADIPLEQLVPGDVVLLAAGDPIPAEVRFLEAVDRLTWRRTTEADHCSAMRAAYRDPDDKKVFLGELPCPRPPSMRKHW